MKEFCVYNLKPKVLVSIIETNISRLSPCCLDIVYNKQLDKWKLCLNYEGLFLSTIWLPSDVVVRYYRICYVMCLNYLPF